MSAERKILVADDDSSDVFFLQRAFARAGIKANIDIVRDGDQAIHYLRAARQDETIPDLLLLDLKMPRVNGFEVLAWVRAQPWLTGLLVLVLTSSDVSEDINRAYDLGANAYLVKPLYNEQLVSVVQCLHRYWIQTNLCPESVPIKEKAIQKIPWISLANAMAEAP